MKLGIQLHLSRLSLSNTVSVLDRLGVDRYRTTVHRWVQKAGRQPAGGATPDYVALDETVIQLNDQRHWLYTTVDPDLNHQIHIRLFHTCTSQLTVGFLRELQRKHDLNQATVLVDDAAHLEAALGRLGLRFQVSRHGNRNSVERVFHGVKPRTSSFSNTFSNAATATAES